MKRPIIVICISLFFGLEFAAAEVGDFSCGALQNAYGPYDYRKDKDKLPIVEGAHLTPDVINLVKGKSGYIGGDLDYTLRAFPNHPRALMAMLRLGEREKATIPLGAHYSVECYFQRAMRFRADDSMVKMIYATYLAKNGRGADALKQLNEVVALGEESANLYYNMGLVYLDLKQYDKALSNAHLAYRMGFPLPGLRDRLKKAGKWSAPVPQAELAPRENAEPAAAHPEDERNPAPKPPVE